MRTIFEKLRNAVSPRDVEVRFGWTDASAAAPAVAIDFSGERAHASRADASLTFVEPRRVLDVADFVRRRGCAPGMWLVVGIDVLPMSPRRAADFVVALARRGRCPVTVDDEHMTRRARRRFAAYLHRSATDARQRGLSPCVRVLSSGRTCAA